MYNESILPELEAVDRYSLEALANVNDAIISYINKQDILMEYNVMINDTDLLVQESALDTVKTYAKNFGRWAVVVFKIISDAIENHLSTVFATQNIERTINV